MTTVYCDNKRGCDYLGSDGICTRDVIYITTVVNSMMDTNVVIPMCDDEKEGGDDNGESCEVVPFLP